MGKLLGEAFLSFAPGHCRIGPAPDEVIFHYVVASGTFRGARIRLSSLPNCGVEWNRVGGDGVAALESRQVLRSPSGDLVCASISGVCDLGDDGYVAALGDALTLKVSAELVIRFETGSKNYRWLNRKLFIGHGQRDFTARTLSLRIFSIDE